eukprot:47966_1
MLVCAYIRSLESCIKQLIPLDIVSLCESFYYSKDIFIYLLQRKNYDKQEQKYQIHMVDCNPNSSVYSSNEIKFTTIPSSIQYPTTNIMSLDENDNSSTFYYAKNVLLPTTHNSQYDAIFESNGSQELKAILINRDTKKAMNYILPNLPISLENNCLLHSRKHGLFSIGGHDIINDCDTSNVYNLPAIINKQTTLSWKWSTLPFNLDYHTSHVAATIVNIDHKEHIFTAGGLHLLPSRWVRLYNLDDNGHGGWQKLCGMNEQMCNAGMCFDADFNRVYICGKWLRHFVHTGSVAYYDFMCDKWFQMPDVFINRFDNTIRPIMWKGYKHTLFVASKEHDQYSVECMDIRIAKQWFKIDWYQPHLTSDDKNKTIADIIQTLRSSNYDEYITTLLK